MYKPYLNYNCIYFLIDLTVDEIKIVDELVTKLEDEVKQNKNQSKTLMDEYQSLGKKQSKTEKKLESVEKELQGIGGHLDHVSSEISEISKLSMTTCMIQNIYVMVLRKKRF